jgi:alanyl-tRNA synthetase
MALFGEKYSAEVRVLTMGDGFSVELCGGTHAARTGDIGIFRIVSEQGVASGVRRIEAITGSAALTQVESNEDLLSQAGSLVRADNHNLADKLRALIDQNKKLEKTIADLNRKLATGGVGPDIAESAIDLGGVKLVVSQLDGADPKSLPDVLDQLKNKIGSGIIVLGTVSEGKVGLIVGVTKDLTDRFHAGDLVNHIASQVGGKGGGRPDMARAGGSDPDSLPAALASVEQFARNLL